MDVVEITDMPVGSDVTENVKIPKTGDANRAWLWGTFRYHIIDRIMFGMHLLDL